MTESFLDGRVTLHGGDCIEVLKSMDADSVDSICTDPPYHLTSIVKRFGVEGAAEARNGKTGAFKRASAGFMGKQWDGGDIAFQPEVWAECLRVLKPGGYLLAFASTRGFGRMSVAIEEAGFITHPLIAWVFGSGFPKATRVKADGYDGLRYGGQSLKPAIEPIYMGQKPFEKGLSGTENILKHGTGAVNIDGCRVGTEGGTKTVAGDRRNTTVNAYGDGLGAQGGSIAPIDAGRWPANIVHDGSDEVVGAFPDAGGGYGKRGSNKESTSYGFADGNMQTVGFGDSGSAARFFYTAKADKLDRIGSKHPTVKPVDLMQWLVRLVTPKGGVVLDPFAGSGSTGEAAWREGMRCILIEREAEYQNDIRERMRLCLAGPDERKREIAKRRGATESAGPLFGDFDGAPA